MSDGVRIIQAEGLLAGDEVRTGVALKVDLRSGRIVEIGPAEALRGELGRVAGQGLADVLDLPGRILIPGAVNAHSHAFQVLLRGFGDHPRDFHDWVARALYPLVLSLSEEDLESSMLLAFAEMALNGVTAVGEFFYIHNDAEERGFTRLGNRYAALAIRCARRVGLRIALLRTMYDRGERPAQRRFHEGVEEACGHVRALAREHAADLGVTVGPAPHSIHGASAEMLAAAGALAAELDRPLHIHLAEQRSDIETARELHGATPLRALDRLGLVTPRLVVVHGCWLDREELERLGAAGAGLVYNPGANLFLGDGATDLEAAARAGVRVAFGSDGPGANSRLDLFGEMRIAEGLERLKGLRMGVLEPARLLVMATRNGATSLGFDAGEIAPGRLADLVALDAGDISLLPGWGRSGRALISNLVHAANVRAALRDVIVGGEVVVRDRVLARIDQVELRGRAGALERRLGPVAASWLATS